MKSIAKTTLNDEEYEILGQLVDELTELIGDDLRGIWLYGSRARGEGGEHSDIDILVIVARDWKRWDDDVMNIGFAIERRHDKFMLIKVITRDLKWLKQRREIEAFFIQEVDRDKKVLYGDVLI